MKFRGPEALNDTYKKQAGWGCYGPSWSHLHTGTLPRPISFVCHCYENRLSGVENKDLRVRTWPRSIFMHGGAPKAHEVSYENCRVCTPNCHSGRGWTQGCTPDLQTFNL